MALGTILGIAAILGLLASKIYGDYGEAGKLKSQQKFIERAAEKQTKSAAVLQQRQERAATRTQKTLAEMARQALVATRQARSQQELTDISSRTALMGMAGLESPDPQQGMPPAMFSSSLAELRRQGLLSQQSLA